MERVEMADYINSEVIEDKRKAMKDREKHDSAIRVYRVVGVSFGLLCVLQASLNISLRLLPAVSAQYPGSLRFQGCPTGWTTHQSSCYLVSSEQRVWEEAERDCLERGAHLVVINSREEQVALHRLNGAPDDQVWIGLTDADTEGSWTWVDGTPLTTQYWANFQPNNGRPLSVAEEDCVFANRADSLTASWYDGPCNMALYWMCEKAIK